MKWQYLVVNHGSYIDPRAGEQRIWTVNGQQYALRDKTPIWEVLNNLGLDGWELLGNEATSPGGYLMKRPLK